MGKSSKIASVVFVFMMIVGILAAGCTKKDDTSSDTKDSNAESSNPSAPADSGSKPEERIKMTMFMTDSGLAHPANIDPSDNKYIKIIEDYANVDLQVEVPPFTDFGEKYKLLLASGNLPDIVQTNEVVETTKVADQGAFIDLKEYYDKSPLVQKIITPEMMELAKSASGHYYRIPMSWVNAPQGYGIDARYDLIEKYNDGKWPGTVEEWVDLMRRIHQAEPESVILSSGGSGNIGQSLDAIYRMWYGVSPYGYRIDGGKVIPNVTLPEYREATILARQLYSEGILDKEFATNDIVKFNINWNTKNTLFEFNGADQIVPLNLFYKEGTNADQTKNEKAKSYKIVFAPPLTTFPSVLKDKKYTQPFADMPIIDHGLWIPTSTKNKDRAWKVIEAFATDKLYDAIFWGEEGVTYKVENGKKVPLGDKLGPATLPGTDEYWAFQLALIFGFVDGQDAKKTIAVKKFNDPAFSDQLYASLDNVQKLALENGIGGMPQYEAPDEASKKSSESIAAISKLTVEAIMSKITMEQFDQKVKEWEAKYREVIYGPRQKFLDENKQKLIDMGVKQAGW